MTLYNFQYKNNSFYLGESENVIRASVSLLNLYFTCPFGQVVIKTYVAPCISHEHSYFPRKPHGMLLLLFVEGELKIMASSSFHRRQYVFKKILEVVREDSVMSVTDE